MIELINQKVCKMVKERVTEVLEKIAADVGLNIDLGGGKFNDHSFTIKLEFSIKDPSGKPKAQVEFENSAFLFKLSPDDYGKTFKVQNGTYRIIGTNIRSSKYPILAEEVVFGKRFAFPTDVVKLAFSSEKR